MGASEHGSEPSDFIKCKNILDKLSKYEVLIKNYFS
jgi:hypothetical protein